MTKSAKANGNVVRVHKNTNYTTVDNSILSNKNLSLKAKGLLILLISLPENWQFTEAGLTSLSRDGRDGVRSGLKELESSGHLIREPDRNGNGNFKMIYHIYEVPKKAKSEENNASDSTVSALPTRQTRVGFTELDNPHNKILTIKDLNKVLNNKVSVIFDFWNSLGIVKHRKLTDVMIGRINGKLEDYSIEEIQTSMSNYLQILNDDLYFLTYRWNLVEFMDRAFDKMLDLKSAQLTYRRSSNNSSFSSTTVQPDYEARNKNNQNDDELHRALNDLFKQ